ncbi:anti-sigma factor [Solirubrobacter phytolaccae]|uniref:Regulator of SigK n=1 Tax=Solirubrobacter phytolaccae TaxID=1404360 RepID=A0A9X3NB02_9ACTN|nr:anti-sigma factor [Solirubrobacter phytolaccae]MDA0183083.1 anti-sigma factor [Solirubrobacter phytolaccae]
MSDATDYLLGEMDPERAADFERALATDTALRAEVDALRPVVTRLEHLPADGWDAAAPPPLRLPGMPEPSAPRRARRLVLRPAVAALCALALLAGGVGLGVLLDRDPEPSTPLALAPVGGLDPTATGRVGVGSDRVTVRVNGLRPTGDGEFYELWLLGEQQQLVGLGSFRVDKDGTATLRLPLPVDPGAFRYFDVSLEAGDGDPGHSGVSVLRGPST